MKVEICRKRTWSVMTKIGFHAIWITFGIAIGYDDLKTNASEPLPDDFSCTFQKPKPASATYFASADGLKGDSLRSALHKIISENAKKLSYSEVWDVLAFTDEDPCNNKNVILIYTGRSQDKEDRDRGGSVTGDEWNREHVWAKSHGFPRKSQAAYTDIHHLRPADRTVNSSRGHKDFDDGGKLQGEAPGTFTDRDSWEPRDAVKGDVARMMFYMAVRYEGDDSVPDLRLLDEDTPSNEASFGYLCTLLRWHNADGVSAWEKRRNNRIHERQGNRNPFVDNPDWADSIWRPSCPELTS